MKKIVLIIMISTLTLIGGQGKKKIMDQKIVTPVERIMNNLKQIENLYISRLDFDDRRKAIQLLDKTVNLVKKCNLKSKPTPNPRPNLLNTKAYNIMLRQVKEASGGKKRINIIRTTIKNKKLTSNQLKKLLTKFRYESYKEECIYAFYKVVHDKENIHTVLSTIGNSFTKKRVEKYIREH